MDINFSLNPGSIVGNTGCSSDFFVKSSKSNEVLKLNNSNGNLPKLVSSIFENGSNTKKSTSNLLSHTPSAKGFQKFSWTKKNMERQDTKDKSLQDMIHEIKGLEEIKIGSITHIDNIESDGESSQAQMYAFKTQLIGLKRKISSLERENQDLKGQLKMYRDLVLKTSLKDDDMTSREKTLYTEIDGSASCRNPNTSSKSTFAKTTTDPALHERLANILKGFSKTQSLTLALDSTLREVCKALDCNFGRILIVNEQIKKVCEDFGSDKIKPEKLRIGNIDADLIEKNQEAVAVADYELLNTVDSMNELKKVITNDKRMVSYPIYSINDPNELWGAIQVLGPMTTTKYERSKRKSGFNLKDEIILEIFTKIISIFINFYENEWISKEQEKKILSYNGISNIQILMQNFKFEVTSLVSSGTYQELARAIKIDLPNYIGFENVGLLLYDSNAELLYTYDVQQKANGTFHTLEPFKYPAKMGISGKCIMNEIDVYALSEPRQTREFQPEIDNIAGAHTVKNIIIALIKDSKDRKVGVLQLVNKRNSQTLNEDDKNTARSIQKLLGALVMHTGQIFTAANFSSSVNQTVQKLENNFQS